MRQIIAGDQKELEKHSSAEAVAALKEFDQKAAKLQGPEGGFGGGGGRAVRQAPAFAALNRNLASLATVVDGQDAAPTPVMQTAYEGYCGELASVVKSWNELMKSDLVNVNGELEKQNLGPLAAAPLTVPACK
jgi:hypothetical protein